MTRKNQAARTLLSRNVVAALATTGLVVSPLLYSRALAQETGGVLATLDVTTGLVYEDEEDGEDQSALQTQLSFGLSSITRTQRLTFLATGLFDLADPSEEDPFRPSLAFGYGTENRDTVLDVGATYRAVDIETVFPDPEEEFENADLLTETGTRRDASLSFGLETGRTARFGTETAIVLRDRSYVDTVNPDLGDLESQSIRTSLRFTLTPTLDLRVTGSRFESDEDDALITERERSQLGVGIDATLDKLWALSLDVGYAEFVTTNTVPGLGRIEDEETGADVLAAATRDLQNGSLSFSLARTINENGFRDTFQVGRSLEFAGGATFRGAAGITAFEEGDPQPFFELGYRQSLKSSAIVLSLAQEGDVNDEGDNVIQTSGLATYERSLTERSGLSLTGRLAAIDVLSGSEDDTARAEVGLGYNYAVTRDWDLTAAVQHRARYNDGDRTDSSNILSLNISRSFAFRP
ncbi:hypothetical protein JSE7799_00556 [Jannaschia seosinensis]|uniref:Outer membrane beta-barrel protein n=1 Tax=Jannaschia seosinensis TaxID=313367 RepID=A0A0M7B4V8_9RHOB|nr:hypothetical protein [Jannaschia seosinensis]CUH21447.1 hypothetical protein JSE7799_00556 [Jannaschia seosinensis]